MVAEEGHAVGGGAVQKILLSGAQRLRRGKDDHASVGRGGAQILIKIGRAPVVQKEGVLKAGKLQRRGHGRSKGGRRDDGDFSRSRDDGRHEGGEQSCGRGEAFGRHGQHPVRRTRGLRAEKARAGAFRLHARFAFVRLPAVEGEGYGRLEQGAQRRGRAFIGVCVKIVVRPEALQPVGQLENRTHAKSPFPIRGTFLFSARQMKC